MSHPMFYDFIWGLACFSKYSIVNSTKRNRTPKEIDWLALVCFGGQHFVSSQTGNKIVSKPKSPCHPWHRDWAVSIFHLEILSKMHAFQSYSMLWIAKIEFIIWFVVFNVHFIFTASQTRSNKKKAFFLSIHDRPYLITFQACHRIG